MKIGIIGKGFVGKATGSVLEKAHEVVYYDKYIDEYKDLNVLKNCDVIFLCVPTPMRQSGEIDYSIIKDSLNSLMNVRKEGTVVIRSTATSGTCKKLSEEYPFEFVSNPEFLREKHAEEDMLNTEKIVIGADDEKNFEIVKKVYFPIFPSVKYLNVDTKTAEMIKYASNVTLIGQIQLANEIYKICETLGVDYDKVKNTLLLDKRIGNNINVPGHDGDFGFGGKCFPKDLNALIYLAKEKGYTPTLLEEIWKTNERIRTNKDWLNIKGATSENKG